MVLGSYPPTRKQLVGSAAMFVTGIGLIALGIHLSYANIEQQRARVKARNDYIKARLRKWLNEGMKYVLGLHVYTLKKVRFEVVKWMKEASEAEFLYPEIQNTRLYLYQNGVEFDS